MGIYAFNTKFLFEELIRDADDKKSSHDFGKDLIPHLVEKYRVFAQSFDQSCVGTGNDKVPYRRDVGTIDSYWEANMELTKVIPDLTRMTKNGRSGRIRNNCRPRNSYLTMMIAEAWRLTL